MGRNFDDYPGYQQIPGMPTYTFTTECTFVNANLGTIQVLRQHVFDMLGPPTSA